MNTALKIWGRKSGLENGIDRQSPIFSLVTRNTFPGGIPRREPPNCEAPWEPTIDVLYGEI